MERPVFLVTLERLRAYADMFGVAVSDDAAALLAEQLAGGLEGLAALRRVDIEGIEPFVAFPVDRTQT